MGVGEAERLTVGVIFVLAGVCDEDRKLRKDGRRREAKGRRLGGVGEAERLTVDTTLLRWGCDENRKRERGKEEGLKALERLRG